MARKVINFKPNKKQFQALQYLLDDVTDEVLYGGAGGGGKSFLGCAWLIIMCSKYPKSRWLMGRSKLATLKATTLKTFFEVCRQFNLQAEFDYSFNAGSNVITFKNGSEILLKDLFYYPSDPDFDSLGSLEIAGAFIDEVAQISAKAREVVKSRLGWKLEDGTEIKTKLFMSCNPNKGFAYKDFYLPFSKGELKSTFKFVPAFKEDNAEYLSKGRMEALENLTGTLHKRLNLGMWEYDSDPSSLIEYDNILNTFNNEQILVYNDKREIIGTKLQDGTILKDRCISVDVARLGEDDTIILNWIGLYVESYKLLSKSRTNETAAVVKEMRNKHNVPMSNVVVDADGIGGGVTDQLRGCVEFLNGSSPLNKENYANLKSQCYFKLADVTNKNEIYLPIDDEDMKTRVTEELEQVKRKDIYKDGKLAVIPKEQVKAVLRRSPDFSDAMMLRMYPILKKSHQTFEDMYSFSL